MEHAARLPRLAIASSLALVAACSADHKAPTENNHPFPIVHASVQLAFSGTSPLFNSRANAINDSAVVVGLAAVTPTDVMKAVVWRPPSYAFAFLPDLGAQGESVANAVGNDGTIGGEACENSGACHSVFWRASTIHQLDGFGQVNAINASGTAVGVSNVMWANGSSSATPIPDGHSTTAVNDSGVVAGTFSIDTPFDIAGTWTQSGGWVMIGSEMNPTITGIDNSGAVVGFFHHQGEDFAVLWQQP